jgi:SPX domain protein involved in polyphosphate accumulation
MIDDILRGLGNLIRRIFGFETEKRAELADRVKELEKLTALEKRIDKLERVLNG